MGQLVGQVNLYYKINLIRQWGFSLPYCFYKAPRTEGFSSSIVRVASILPPPEGLPLKEGELLHRTGGLSLPYCFLQGVVKK